MLPSLTRLFSVKSICLSKGFILMDCLYSLLLISTIFPSFVFQLLTICNLINYVDNYFNDWLALQPLINTPTLITHTSLPIVSQLKDNMTFYSYTLANTTITWVGQ